MLSIASNVLFVKGYKRNLIIDLQNDAWYHVDFTLNEENLSDLNDDTLDYLISEGMVFEVPDFVRKNLSSFNLEYTVPAELENAVIDLNAFSDYSLESAINLLIEFRCKCIQIRSYDAIEIEKLQQILEYAKNSPIESVELILKFDDNYRSISLMTQTYVNVTSLIFHSVSPDFQDTINNNNVLFTVEELKSSANCGIISPFMFTGKQAHVLKAINFNTCLHKKIGIDVEGNLKNCPSMKTSLGPVSLAKKQDLQKMIANQSFHKKDEIEVCQDCEFRYVCNDCRVFTDSSQRPNARPAKCNYNPYISKWPHEAGYYSFEDCGVISSEELFSVDHDKIKALNGLIWVEE